MTYVKGAYDACINKHPSTTTTECDIPCAVNTPLHQTSFLVNSKVVFHVLEFTLSAGILFKTKTLWKLRLQIELHLVWRQHLPATTVNFLPF